MGGKKEERIRKCMLKKLEDLYIFVSLHIGDIQIKRSLGKLHDIHIQAAACENFSKDTVESNKDKRNPCSTFNLQVVKKVELEKNCLFICLLLLFGGLVLFFETESLYFALVVLEFTV